MYTSQFIYAGKNAALTIGNVLHARHPPSLVPPLQGQNVPYTYVLSKMTLELSCK
ncbi:hypothetical protein AA0112_g2020 [Alternaria arborescens]|nr:hypothetical protein AA0112_g2020 [Alternaria arborescens]